MCLLQQGLVVAVVVRAVGSVFVAAVPFHPVSTVSPILRNNLHLNTALSEGQAG